MVELLEMVECGKTMLPQLGLLTCMVFLGMALSSRSAFSEGKRSADMMQIGADLDRAGDFHSRARVGVYPSEFGEAREGDAKLHRALRAVFSWRWEGGNPLMGG